MATTKINIVNRALGLLGAEFISSLTEDTKSARFANEYLMILEMHYLDNILGIAA